MFPFMIMFAKQAMTMRRISAAAVLIRVILFAATVPDLGVDAVSLTANEEYRREYLRLQGPQRASAHRGGRQHNSAGSSTRRSSGTNASTPTSSDSDIELRQHYTAGAAPDTCDACADDLCRRMRKCDRRLAAHGLCSLSQAAVCSLATAGAAVLGIGAWNMFRPVPPCRTYLYVPGGLLEESAASASGNSLEFPGTSSTSRGATTGGPDGVHQPVSRGGRLLLQVEEANRRLADYREVLDEKQRRPRFLAAAMTEHSGASPKDTLTEIPGHRLFKHLLDAGESSDSTVTKKFNYPDIFQSDVCSDLIIPQNAAAEYQDGVAMPAYVKCDPRNLDECLIRSGKFS